MKPLLGMLILILAASPALARSYSAHVNPKNVTGCMPSSDPSVPPCGVKDEAPTYFPDKLATPDVTKTAVPADTTATPANSKITKHTKPKATIQDDDAQTH